jgi:hypothetical protein
MINSLNHIQKKRHPQKLGKKLGGAVARMIFPARRGNKGGITERYIGQFGKTRKLGCDLQPSLDATNY